MKIKIAFIGLGTMSLQMALNLTKSKKLLENMAKK
jgi:3-hydroxyisobutyrate dehydrogenase-like beta-hydroxyacid dehydrogenase